MRRDAPAVTFIVPARLAPDHHALLAVRAALPGLEAQARVPAVEARRVGEGRRAPLLVLHDEQATSPKRSGARASARRTPSASTTPPFMSTVPEPTMRSSARSAGRWSRWATTVSTWPRRSTLRPPVPRTRASKSGACPGDEQAGRVTSASGGTRAAMSAAASSPPCASPEGVDTATSASSSRSARVATSAASRSTQGSMRVHPKAAWSGRGSSRVRPARTRRRRMPRDEEGGPVEPARARRAGDRRGSRRESDCRRRSRSG